ncbi:hypothetical protein [Ramlibacter humi]|uniref:Uncharacterized protein n=1 Tax=Ramlibacter humi TaxID=2530451 RepID=A0A4Z0BVN5_9BURK|nr:hypothetical protein [Ramlibacter humi]TFZ02105.1 hypothetical protein EZ216_13095 [Ramlibacter humi]
MRAIALGSPVVNTDAALLTVARQGFCRRGEFLLLRAKQQALPSASQEAHATILEAAVNSLHTDDYVQADHWSHAIAFLETLAQAWSSFSPAHPGLEALVTMQGTTRGVHISLTAARTGWSNCPKDLHRMVLPIMEARLVEQPVEELIAA